MAEKKINSRCMFGIGCLFFHSMLDVRCSMLDVHLFMHSHAWAWERGIRICPASKPWPEKLQFTEAGWQGAGRLFPCRSCWQVSENLTAFCIPTPKYGIEKTFWLLRPDNWLLKESPVWQITPWTRNIQPCRQSPILWNCKVFWHHFVFIFLDNLPFFLECCCLVCNYKWLSNSVAEKGCPVAV